MALMLPSVARIAQPHLRRSERRPLIRSAFTLIELLVVVSIIAVLMAILIPALGTAHEEAKATQCASHMREMGQLVTLFAADHDGRGPGGGDGLQGKPLGSGPGTSSLAWNDVLNAEVLQRPDNTAYGVGSREAASSAAKYLACPNYSAPDGDWSRPFCYNGDAAGGYDAIHFGGEYSLDIHPPNKMDGFYPGTAPLTQYFLGAKLVRFRPNQFLIIESYAGNDSTGGVESMTDRGSLPGPFNPGPAFTNVTYGPVSGPYGPAWRHPFFKGANFLYFDGHVDKLKPGDDVADHPSNFSGWSLIGPSHWAMPL